MGMKGNWERKGLQPSGVAAQGGTQMRARGSQGCWRGCRWGWKNKLAGVESSLARAHQPAKAGLSKHLRPACKVRQVLGRILRAGRWVGEVRWVGGWVDEWVGPRLFFDSRQQRSLVKCICRFNTMPALPSPSAAQSAAHSPATPTPSPSSTHRHVLVAAATAVEDDARAVGHGGRQLVQECQGVGGLQGGDDALQAGHQLEGAQRLVVCRGAGLDALA